MFKIIKPSLIFFAAVVAGGLAFVAMTPNRCSDIAADSSIFVLTGDARRIPFAKKLLDGFPKRNLYIIGVGGGVSNHADNRIHFEVDSRNTYENAIAIKKIVADNNLFHIVVITTEDHMNRSFGLIKKELPNIAVTACPVPLTDMPVQMRIWRWGSEYFKYIGTLLGFKTRG